jgi:predicted flap endonuclease-1-like 5' DNA nuclease
VSYLLSQFWIWMLAALALGGVVGLREAPGAWRRNLLPWLIALAIGGLVAVLALLPRRFGFWLEIGLLMLAAYLIGAVLASMLFGARGAQGARIASPAAPVRQEPLLERAVEPAATAPEPEAGPAIEEAITGLSAPRGGKGDDLTRIHGIDRETEAKLNALGLYHYDQLASLSPGQRRWLFRHLGYSGRFPGWWWRWRYDARQLLDGAPADKAPAVAPEAVAATSIPATAKPDETAHAGTKPAGLSAPRGGKADDLKRIKGIGKQNEGRLHGLGIWHFDQIAGWSAEEVIWVGSYLAFPGRIEREDWVGQARLLARGEETEFSKRADAGLVATSRDETGDDGQSNVIPLKPAAKPPRKGG